MFTGALLWRLAYFIKWLHARQDPIHTDTLFVEALEA